MQLHLPFYSSQYVTGANPKDFDHGFILSIAMRGTDNSIEGSSTIL